MKGVLARPLLWSRWIVVIGGLNTLAAASLFADQSPDRTDPDRPDAVAAGQGKETTLPGLDGRPVSLAAPQGGFSVLLFYSSECPIANAYGPTYNKLAATFPKARLRMVGICVDADLSDEEVRAHGSDFDLRFPLVRDRGGRFARQIGAQVTPEAFVLDDRGQIRYFGRIDDQFTPRRERGRTGTGNELRDALRALLNGKEPPFRHVEAAGCPIPEPDPDSKSDATTTQAQAEDEATPQTRSRDTDRDRNGKSPKVGS
jgi:peroxiredoxin